MSGNWDAMLRGATGVGAGLLAAIERIAEFFK